MSNRKVVVIGGGIIGLATARELSASGFKVILLEKEGTWGAHQTGHNSGVVHAGPYYKPGSLKAKMCATGNKSMKNFAIENDVPYSQTGKVIVATEDKEIPGLDRLYDRAIANGVHVKRLNGEQTKELEPHVSALASLRFEETGIIDYTEVSNKLASHASNNGAELILEAKVVAINERPNGIEVVHTKGEIAADFLVNCAGLYSDKIARLAGVDPQMRIIPFRGEYYELHENKRNLVRGLIYPVPDPNMPFLGVHLTKMIDGTVHAGPNAVTALSREGYRWRDVKVNESLADLTYSGFLKLAINNLGTGLDEIVRSVSKSRFAASLARLVPEITSSDIVRAGSGVRAQAILSNGTLVDDFLLGEALGNYTS